MKRPAFQFYPSDWRTDAALQSCSIAARGLWHELLCIMHDCTPYGHLSINGVGIDEAQAARLAGVSLSEYRKLLCEIERFGVFSKTTEGLIYSRRMVKDERLRDVRGGAGRLGGNPRLVANLVKQKSNQVPTPSSSSSSSSSKNLNPKPEVAALPGWLAAEVWDGFAAHRKALKKPMTPHAERLLLAELGRLRERGHDPTAVINRSIASGWLGLFPLDSRKGNDFGQRRIDTVSALTGRGDSNVIDITPDAVDRKTV